jgi:glycosyltransferase involved in cell wall biosynthesis
VSPKKKILVFIDWFVPGYKAGGPIRSCANLIDHLKDEYDFSVVTRDTDYCESTPYPSVKSDAWNVLPNGVRVYYFSQSSLNRENIHKLLDSEQYDLIYLNGIYSPYFTLIPLRYARKKSKRVIVAARGMLGKSALAVKSTKKKLFLSFVKLSGLFRDVLFHATTADEEIDIQEQLGRNTSIRVAPNLPRKQDQGSLVARKKEPGVVKIVNIARIAPEKNLEYALEVLAKVKGNVEFHFYGPVYDVVYWDKCEALLSRMPSNVKAVYKNAVDTSLIPSLLKNYHFMLMPTRGENFGHIILESLSAGCPVIISDQTPWKKLEEKKAGWDISLSDNLQFISVIEQCSSMTQQEYDEWSKCAYEEARRMMANSSLLVSNRLLFG